MSSAANLLTLLTTGLILISVPSPIGAYNILGIFPSMSRSHHISGSSLMRGLAKAGHNVTVISPFPLATPVPNYRDIAVLGVGERLKDVLPDILATHHRNPLLALWLQRDLGYLITNTTLTHTTMRRFLADPNERFDAIICEVFLNEALLGLGHHFGAPVIGYSTFGASMWTNDMVGTPSPLSYVPHAFLGFTDRMTFGQRVANVLMTAYQAVAYRWHLYTQAALYDSLFPARTTATKPSLDRLRRNVSLILLNTHHTLGTPRPYMPNMIEIGGVHIDGDHRLLPDAMRAFIEGATHGCIYFAMGSNIRSVDLPRSVLEGVLRAFGRLPQRVLFKWEDVDLVAPQNVMISPWFAQQDVLAHPNVRLFITHGGLLSLTEAVYHGVPLIGVPVFFDQSLNMARAEAAGYARTVHYTNLTEASLLWAVQEVLGDESYQKKAALVSRRYRDQPMTPMQTGVYWVEYVVRHNGAPHLHCAGLELSMWAYHSLDVYGVIMGVLMMLVWIVWWGVKRFLCSSRNSEYIYNVEKKLR